MSYTNQTPNYALPQYVADDKPTYLGDFNKAMLDIDTAIKNASDTATGSQTIAQNANNISTEALNTAQSASATATSAQTKADTAKTVADNAQTTAENAQTQAGNAETLAQNANQVATTAKTNSETAVSTANSAQSTADATQSSLNNLLKNNYNESTTNGYSCDYLNTQFKNIDGTLLWTNPNPSSPFDQNSINVDLSEYDAYEIIAKSANDNNTSVTSGLVFKSLDTRLISAVSGNLAWRDFIHSDSGFTVGSGHSPSSTNNPIFIIPYYIIGYKTNIQP